MFTPGDIASKPVHYSLVLREELEKRKYSSEKEQEALIFTPGVPRGDFWSHSNPQQATRGTGAQPVRTTQPRC